MTPYPTWFIHKYMSYTPEARLKAWEAYIEGLQRPIGQPGESLGTNWNKKQPEIPSIAPLSAFEYPDYIPETKPTNPKDRCATNRLDLSLFPATARAYGAIGMTEGDCKYGGYNYREFGVSASVYYAACGRHMDDWYNGEWADRKTGVPHLASALACIAILIDSHEMKNMKDDRPPKVNFRQLLIEAEAVIKKLHELFPNGPARVTEVALEKGDM